MLVVWSGNIPQLVILTSHFGRSYSCHAFSSLFSYYNVACSCGIKPEWNAQVYTTKALGRGPVSLWYASYCWAALRYIHSIVCEILGSAPSILLVIQCRTVLSAWNWFWGTSWAEIGITFLWGNLLKFWCRNLHWAFIHICITLFSHSANDLNEWALDSTGFLCRAQKGWHFTQPLFQWPLYLRDTTKFSCFHYFIQNLSVISYLVEDCNTPLHVQYLFTLHYRLTEAHRSAIRVIRRIRYFVAKRKFQVWLINHIDSI